MLELTPTHAGGVVCRTGPAGIEILLVTAMGAPHEWVLPKGRIKRHEAPLDAALREVREEAGVVAAAVPEVAWYDSRFSVGEPPREIVARYFRMSLLDQVASAEPRAHAWLPLAEAIARATHDSTKHVLRALILR